MKKYIAALFLLACTPFARANSNPIYGTVQTVLSQTISVNTTWTNNTFIASGQIITVNTGITLTINGTIQAGLYKIFNCLGTGKVVFYTPEGTGTNTLVVYPEWWGAKGDGAPINGSPGGTDNLAFINAAIGSLPASGGKVQFQPAIYYISGTILWGSGSWQVLEGAVPLTRGNIIPHIVSTSNSATVLQVSGADNLWINNLYFSRTAMGIAGSKTIDVENSIFMNINNSGWQYSQYGLYVRGSGVNLKHNNASVNGDLPGNSVYGMYVNASTTTSNVVSEDYEFFGDSSYSPTTTIYGIYFNGTGGGGGIGDDRFDGFYEAGYINYGIYFLDGSGFSSDVYIKNVSMDTVMNEGIHVESQNGPRYYQQMSIDRGWINLATSTVTGIDIKGRMNTNISHFTISSDSTSDVGIGFYGSQNGTISDNNLVDSIPFGSAIRLDTYDGYNSSSNTVTANTCDFGSTVTVVAGSNGNFIVGNTCGVLNSGLQNTAITYDRSTGFARFDNNGASGIIISSNGVNEAQYEYSAGSTYIDYTGPLIFRSGINGITSAAIDSAGNFSTIAALQLTTATHATINALVPGAAGKLYECTDCSTVPVCISTGTTVGSWSLITNRASVCQ